MEKRNVPKFTRQNSDRLKRVGKPWRKPRGIDNKMRIFKSGFGASPRVGYRQPKAIRGKHPSGVHEALVCSLRDLAAVPQGVAVRISATLGAKKRSLVVAKARERKLVVLN